MSDEPTNFCVHARERDEARSRLAEAERLIGWAREDGHVCRQESPEWVEAADAFLAGKP